MESRACVADAQATSTSNAEDWVPYVRSTQSSFYLSSSLNSSLIYLLQCGETNTDDQLIAAVPWEIFDNWPGASYNGEMQSVFHSPHSKRL